MSASAFPCPSQWQKFLDWNQNISLGKNLFDKLQKQNVTDCDGSRAKEPVQQWPPLYRVQPGPGWQDEKKRYCDLQPKHRPREILQYNQ